MPRNGGGEWEIGMRWVGIKHVHALRATNVGSIDDGYLAQGRTSEHKNIISLAATSHPTLSTSLHLHRHTPPNAKHQTADISRRDLW